jgi:hypothetical protein
MNDNRDVPGAVQRVAEIASLLGEDRPSAKQLVKELFVRFAEIQEHYRSVQPVGRAPTDAGEPLQLYCPQQGGWQYGTWRSEHSAWVATLDGATVLDPTHWRVGERALDGAAEKPSPDDRDSRID